MLTPLLRSLRKHRRLHVHSERAAATYRFDPTLRSSKLCMGPLRNMAFSISRCAGLPGFACTLPAVPAATSAAYRRFIRATLRGHLEGYGRSKHPPWWARGPQSRSLRVILCETHVASPKSEAGALFWCVMRVPPSIWAELSAEHPSFRAAPRQPSGCLGVVFLGVVLSLRTSANMGSSNA